MVFQKDKKLPTEQSQKKNNKSYFHIDASYSPKQLQNK